MSGNVNSSTPSPTQAHGGKPAPTHIPTKQVGTPKLYSLKRMKENGLNWREALRKPSSVYISTQKAKYTGNPTAKDFWVHRQLSWRYYKGEIGLDEYLWEFERYARHYLWNYLDSLENKTMYCWCNSGRVCHGRVLQRLFNEKKAMSANPLKKEVGTQTEDMDTTGGVNWDVVETMTVDMTGVDMMDMAGVDPADVLNMEH